jgi:hypothetical protein
MVGIWAKLCGILPLALRHTFPSTYIVVISNILPVTCTQTKPSPFTHPLYNQNMSSDHSTNKEIFGPISLHYTGQINSVSCPHFSRPVTSEPSDAISRYLIWPSPWKGQESSVFSRKRHDQLSGPPSLQWAPGLFPAVKVDGAWWWPPTSTYSRT